MKYVCLVNPVSGRGRALPLAMILAERLSARGHQARILQTAADSAEFRRTCAQIQADETVICLGGDGTLLYFLNHATAYDGIAFYGMGTANVIGIEFNIPKDPEAYVEMLEANHRVSFRPGQTDREVRFLMMAGFGIDGFILSQTSQRLKNRIGKWAFLPAALNALFRYPYPSATLTLDGRTQVKGTFGIISRIRHYGGSHILAPEADPQSNHFQVVVLHKGGMWHTLGLLLRVVRGKLQTGPNLTITLAKEVQIQSDPNLLFQLDGDLMLEQIVNLKTAPETIPLIVPRP